MVCGPRPTGYLEELLAAVGMKVLVEPIARYAERLRENYGDESNVLELAKEVEPPAGWC